MQALLAWFGLHGRALPWRTDRSPYRVVVSEFMLQQTGVDRVTAVFEWFVSAFPSFAQLAAADRADVVRAWRGLGYNSRAVRLHALARTVCERHGGSLPHDAAALRDLPGVGPYTAEAIRAFAFDADTIALDTNVRRVAQRVFFGIEVPSGAPACDVARAAVQFAVAGRCYEVNSALMDLGATICTARAPRCLVCPLRDDCAAAPVDARVLATAARRSGGAASVPFEQSMRFLRGRVVDALRSLPPRHAVSLLDLNDMLSGVTPERSAADVERAVSALDRDGVVDFRDGRVALAR